MYCHVCGFPDSDKPGTVRYYPEKQQALCTYCAANTPAKVSYEEFVKRYFPGAHNDYERRNDPLFVPLSVRRDFYEDYKTSTYTLHEYMAHTRETMI